EINAFDRLPKMFGIMASALEAQTLANLIISNPQLSDGKAVFHTGHANLSATADPIGVSSISKARLAMRKQTGLNGAELISVTPKYLWVPSAQETAAEQALAIIAAAKVEDTNPFSGKLTLVVEPRLTSDTAWYISASPAEIDGLEYAYLESEQGPMIETRAGF